MSQLVIWGAGGHGKVLCDIAQAMSAWSDIVFIDDSAEAVGSSVHGIAVIGGSSRLASLSRSGFSHFIVAIGDNGTRAGCFATGKRHMAPATLIHPASVVSRSATIGEGSVVMPAAVINAGADIGVDCIINTAAVVEHDCKIGNHVHISPGACLGGGAQVHDCAHVGLGALVLPLCAVGAGAIVGAGGVVTRSIPAGITAVGVPARALIRA